ncbi:phage holin family protein [Chitinimonas koreensis]|uniref:phage holin family protein n=1 Tax=Chitinimonas koreensis TaxID=356302 RepID=UPI00040A29DE|nr:phage holin family protein [Chitinimonas koreensis]QNM96385.1 phage holin family protein [Chitinimonas koreensis]
MTLLTCLYGLCCAVIALRLATFARGAGAHRPRAAWLAYLLTVAAGSVPIRLMLGQPVAVDLAGLLLHAALAAALLAVRGNVVDLFRSPCASHSGVLSRLLKGGAR